MSRSGYTEGWDMFGEWDYIRWRGAVKSALNGARGQAFLKEMLAALDALPEKKLIAGELEVQSGAVCAIGAVGRARGIDMDGLDPEDPETVAGVFGIAPAMAKEIVSINDDDLSWDSNEQPEARFARMRAWVERHIDKG